MFDLHGKIALVTGASSGIGRGSAIILAKQGATVVVAARRLEKLTQLVSEITASGGRAKAVQMDVTKKTEINAGISQIITDFGRLDILVNNAGVVEYSSFLEMPEDVWDKILDTNLKGYFLVAQMAAREMVKNRWGRIINIGSVAMGGQGFGMSSITHYVASKGAVVGFTEALADELAPQGILVNCIAPGLIESEMTADIMDNPEQLQGILARVPLKRAGKAEEIAAAIVYLASEEASYTTGATLVVDGGWLST